MDSSAKEMPALSKRTSLDLKYLSFSPHNSFVKFQMKDEFEAEDFCTVVFDEFFFTLIGTDNVIRHLLRLLWYVYAKISTVRMDNLIKLTEPAAAVGGGAGSGVASSIGLLSSGVGGGGTTAEQLAKMHLDLKEKVDSHREAVASAANATEGRADPFI